MLPQDPSSFRAANAKTMRGFRRHQLLSTFSIMWPLKRISLPLLHNNGKRVEVRSVEQTVFAEEPTKVSPETGLNKQWRETQTAGGKSVRVKNLRVKLSSGKTTVALYTKTAFDLVIKPCETSQYRRYESFNVWLSFTCSTSRQVSWHSYSFVHSCTKIAETQTHKQPHTVQYKITGKYSILFV